MSRINIITNSLSRFLGKKPRKDCLDCLTNDILLDSVMSYLDVWDIIRLRQVSKLYYELTHHAALWKRILRTTDIPLPPVPPTARHTADRMTGLEAERLVVRSLSLHMNWESKVPRSRAHWRFDAYHRVLEMTLLPGGRYLVASVSDFKATKYSIVIYALDTFGRSRPIAKTDTATKAYDIRAKYVTIKGHKSIALAYLRRDYHHKTDKRKAAAGHLPNASEYSTYHDIDPDIEFRYECIAIHARLSSLEALADIPIDLGPEAFFEEARKLPPPFENLVRIVAGPTHRLMCPDIEETFDSPYLSVAKYPNDIVFKRLEGGPAGTLTCMPVAHLAVHTHTIKAARLIPQESAVFVVRQIDVPNHPIYAFEKYTIIPAGQNKIAQTRMSDQCILGEEMGQLTHVYIADPNVSPRNDDSILGQLRAQHADPPPPPPLAVYCRRVHEEGFVLARFFPQRIVVEYPPTPPGGRPQRSQPRRPRVLYHYPLGKNDLFEKDAQADARVRILPGVVRPLLVYTPWDDITAAPPISEIRPWIDRGMHQPHIVDAEGFVRPETGKRRQATFGDAPWDGTRAIAFAWDETIGRLVIAEEDSDDLLVYEFAHAPRQDEDSGERLPLPLREIPNPDILHRSGNGVLDLEMDS